MRGHARAQRLGDVERAHAGEALDAQRQVGGEVAVLGALGVFERDLGRGERGQVARLLCGDERPFDQFPQLFANHVPPSLSRSAPGAREAARWRYTRSMDRNRKSPRSSGLLASLPRIARRVLGRKDKPAVEPELPPLLPEPGPSGLPPAPPRIGVKGL